MTSEFNRWLKGLVFCLVASLLINTRVFALDKKTSFALSHYIMALMYEKLGETDKAIEEYKKALKADYKNLVIRLNLASSYIRKNELEQAVKELNLAVKFEPQAVEPHAILSLLYSLQDKIDLATTEYETALQNASKLQPQNIDIYKALGELYLQKKDLKAAVDTYQLILKLSPHDAQAHFYLANVYYELEDKKKTEEELKKALELKPDYHEALNYLGYLYVEENKNLEQAEVMIKKALEMEPNNGAYVDSLGWFYFKQAKYQEAVKELERASTLLEDPVIFDHLGDVYFKLNDIEKAKLNWEKSLKLDSKQDKVKKKIEELK